MSIITYPIKRDGLERDEDMAVSYNGLWKLLIDKNMNKTALMNEVGISSSTIAKMSKGECVSIAILEKLCDRLECDFGDIIHYEKGKDGHNHEKS